mmetsp:Transcript_48230/g.138509  ORF Transcript_48230/g.138509 Transcript_48230/m.138509 type:complete len:258 (-) Transcript_48230:273-1046(-)
MLLRHPCLSGGLLFCVWQRPALLDGRVHPGAMLRAQRGSPPVVLRRGPDVLVQRLLPGYVLQRCWERRVLGRRGLVQFRPMLRGLTCGALPRRQTCKPHRIAVGCAVGVVQRAHVLRGVRTPLAGRPQEGRAAHGPGGPRGIPALGRGLEGHGPSAPSREDLPRVRGQRGAARRAVFGRRLVEQAGGPGAAVGRRRRADLNLPHTCALDARRRRHAAPHRGLGRRAEAPGAGALPDGAAGGARRADHRHRPGRGEFP